MGKQSMIGAWLAAGLAVLAAATLLLAGPVLLGAPVLAQQPMAPAFQPDPNLNPDDQFAPSQITQPMPAAVPAPGGAPEPAPRSKPPATRAAANPAPAAPVPGAPAKPAKPAARPPAAAHTTVACSGPFAKDASMLGLAVAFDSRNMIFTDVDVSGTQVGATVLFPKDPKRRLEVWWSNPASRSGLYLILINGQSTWSGPEGLRLGLTLAQMEKLNHKPFKLKGFDKDGVAAISTWDGGALATLPGGCKAGVNLRADPKAPADAVSALAADIEYGSDDTALRAVKPTISEILIGY